MRFRSCFSVLALVVAAMAWVSCGRARVIPKKTLSKIHAEMFVADEWIKQNHAAARVADTTLFYEPIFNKYGYSTKDYLKSVDVYLSDPESFETVFKDADEILKAHLDVLTADEKEKHRLDSIAKARKDYVFRHFASVEETLKVPYHTDSLRFDIDSAGIPVFVMPLRDTMYDGPRMMVRDTASLDSTAVKVAEAVEPKIAGTPANIAPAAKLMDLDVPLGNKPAKLKKAGTVKKVK